MPWSGVVYRGDNSDEDNIERICSHEHKTRREARECGNRMSTERDGHDEHIEYVVRCPKCEFPSGLRM